MSMANFTNLSSYPQVSTKYLIILTRSRSWNSPSIAASFTASEQTRSKILTANKSRGVLMNFGISTTRFEERLSSFPLMRVQAAPENTAVPMTHPMGVAAVASPSAPRIPAGKKVVATADEPATVAPTPAAPRGLSSSNTLFLIVSDRYAFAPMCNSFLKQRGCDSGESIPSSASRSCQLRSLSVSSRVTLIPSSAN